MDIFEFLLNNFYLFLLIFSRMSGIFIFSPIFSAQNIPMMFKLVLCFFCSLIIGTGLNFQPSALSQPFTILVIKELLLGTGIGFVSYFFTTVFFIAGQILDMKIGFGMANVIDPQNRMQVSLFGNYYYMLSMVIFLTINGHHFLLKAMFDSYNYIPLGQFNFSEIHLHEILRTIASAFDVGVKISFPIITVVILSDLILGVLSKTIPQLNVFIVGMPLKVMVGLMIILIMTPIVFSLMQVVFEQMVDAINVFMKLKT